MWVPSHPGGSGTKHVGLVSPPPSPPRTEWGLWDKNTREFLCKNDRTPLAGRIGLPSPLLILLPAGPTPPPRWAPSRCYSHPPSPSLYLNKCVYHCTRRTMRGTQNCSWLKVGAIRETCGIWLVGCFRFNGPLRQYFSLYRAVSQREGERGEKG